MGTHLNSHCKPCNSVMRHRGNKGKWPNGSLLLTNGVWSIHASPADLHLLKLFIHKITVQKKAKMDAILSPNIMRKPVPQYGLQVSFKVFKHSDFFFFLANSRARDLSTSLTLKERTILVWPDDGSEGWFDWEAGNSSLNCLKFMAQLVSQCSSKWKSGYRDALRYKSMWLIKSGLQK